MELIEQIYEAAAIPERWPDALQSIASRISAAGATLIAVDRAAPVWVCSPSILKETTRYFSDGWALKNDRMEKLLRLGYGGFVRDVDIYEPEEVAELPMVRDFLRPTGLGWSAGLATLVPSGETLLFSVEQRWDNGPISAETLEHFLRFPTREGFPR